MPELRPRVLIVDDHGVFRDCLSRSLEESGEFAAVAAAGGVREAIAHLEKEGTEAVLLDYDLGEERGSDLLRHVREHYPHVRVLVLTAWVEENEIRQLVHLGVNGVILKKHALSTLREAIRTVMDSRPWFDEQCIPMLFAAVPEAPGAFSERERVVLKAVVNGLTNKEIASQLEISESSVKATLQRLFERLGVRSRGQLVREAIVNFKGQY